MKTLVCRLIAVLTVGLSAVTFAAGQEDLVTCYRYNCGIKPWKRNARYRSTGTILHRFGE